MKRLLLVLPVLVLVLPAAASARHETADATKRTICHRTASAKKPYVKVRVSEKQLRAHQRHAADIVPAPAGACPRSILTAARGGIALTTTLLGVAERPEPGDPDGTGDATIRVRRNQGQVCFRYAVRDVESVTGAHIHRGDARAVGPVVVALRSPNAAGVAAGCVAAGRSLVGELLASPGGFYVNVHDADFPGGAVRGQLGSTAGIHLLSSELTGAEEVPPADPNGRGRAAIRIDADSGQLCFTVAVGNVRLPATGAHIHRASAGQNGPVVVALTAPDATGTSRGCATPAAATVAEIVGDPAGFYVNVHTSQFPGGAVRAQLGTAATGY